jgi:hypothetical protein
MLGPIVLRGVCVLSGLNSCFRADSQLKNPGFRHFPAPIVPKLCPYPSYVRVT